MGLLFVHVDEQPGVSFAQWSIGLADELAAFKVDQLQLLKHESFTFDANWKLYIENHIDWLHLWYVHPETLGRLEHSDGKVIRFQEVWSRTITSTVEHCQVASRSDDLGMGYIVRVSDHVIAMEETDKQFSTATWTRDDNKDWILQIGLGDMRGLNVLLDSFVGGSLAAPWVAYTLG